MSEKSITRIQSDTQITTFSPKTFVDIFEPKKCLWNFRDVTNIYMMFKLYDKSSLEEFSILSIKKHFSEKWVIKYTELWIIDLLNFLNLKSSMNKSQIQETAFHIVTTYPRLNIIDITLVFRRLKQGYYGEFYNSIDGSKILISFKKYVAERTDIEADIRRKEQDD